MNVVIATGYHQTVLLDKPRYPWYIRLWTGIPPAPQADTLAPQADTVAFKTISTLTLT
jgi:hypothetical protein